MTQITCTGGIGQYENKACIVCGAREQDECRLTLPVAAIEINRIQSVNALMLAALKAVDSEGRDLDGYGESVMIPSEVWDLVMQAIAAAEGGKP